MSARSSAPPMAAAPPASSPPTARPIRSAGRPCAARWEALFGCRLLSVSRPRRRSTSFAARGITIVATVPQAGHARCRRAELRGPVAIAPRRRRRRPVRCARRRRRYAAHDPDARAGRVVQRRHHRRADSLRGSDSEMDMSLFLRLTRRQRPHRSRRLPRRPRRSPSGCGRGRSTSSSARRISSARAVRCAAPSRAIACNRSSSGARPAPARRRSRASSPA